jgi:multidrug transporter EmrE-like cation transporter
MSQGIFSLRVPLLGALVILSNLAGNFFLSLGMKHASGSWDIGLALRPDLICGVVLLIAWLLLRLALLSATDMSLVLPLTAGFGYILTSLVGQFWLREAVSRWHNVGLALIALGAFLVGVSSAGKRTQ